MIHGSNKNFFFLIRNQIFCVCVKSTLRISVVFFVNRNKILNLSYLEYVSDGNLIVCILKYPPLIKLVRHAKSAISASFNHFNDESVRYSIKLVTLRHLSIFRLHFVLIYLKEKDFIECNKLFT